MSAACDIAWAAEISHRVSTAAEHFVEQHAVGDEQRRLLDQALRDMRLHDAPRGTFLPSVHMPLLVVLGIQGEDDAPIQLAMATALMELGMDLLDDLGDREIGEHWQGWPPSAIQLAAMLVTGAFGQLAISMLPLKGDRIASLQSCVARRLVAIAAGQQLDLQLASSPSPSLDQVERANAGKTGERRALYAELGALYAGAGETVCRAYAEFGREIGIAYQLQSDLHDLLAARDSDDLRNGARTWPIAWALQSLEGGARKQLLEVLDAARNDKDARDQALVLLRRQGVVLRTSLRAELHLQRARKALERAGPSAPAATALLAMASGQSERDAASVQNSIA